MRRLLLLALATLVAFQSSSLRVTASSAPAHLDASYLNALHWRSIGPFRGGRALAVTGVPGEPEHFYFGSVDGGVWESTNAGRTWNPIFDNESVASIGAIAVAPSDVKTLYVGTGEADMRSDIARGDGMYKSTDGGKTWKQIGLGDTRQIGKIVVDPHDANVVYVAALGHQYGPNAERGVFKTTDGGATWSKVLFHDADTGAIDLALDPSNTQTLYASLWQTRRPPWNVYPPSNGPGSGVYKSTDGGKTWTHLANGLPAKVGHVGIAVAPSNPTRVYLQVDSDIDHGGVYRSDDSGATWMHLAGGRSQARIWQRGWYFGGITVDPKNPDVVYVMNTSTYRSTDGGKTFIPIKGQPGGDDYHTLWIEPDDANRMILGSDQGVVVSVDGANTWSSWYNQPTGQFYHVATDNRFPYWVYGAQQDSGAGAVPSTSKLGSISLRDFRPLDSGGENGYIATDPLHPGVIFGSGDSATTENAETGWEQSIEPTLAFPGDIWRHTWTLPIVFSPADHRTLYTSHQRIFRSNDRGHSWTIISPDLTRENNNHPANLDTATLNDSTGLARRGVVYALAPSPLDARLLWAGTDDGYVWITHDGGAHWQNVTPPGVGAWSKIAVIEASHHDRSTAYVAVDRHRLDDDTPYIYRTHDGGKTWTAIANGIAKTTFVNVVREDPKHAGLLYAGTERGVLVSFDDGANWQSLQRNLPVTSVRDIDVHGDDLVLATHGRAFWIMDDVASLREMAEASARDAFLFTPALAYRVRAGSDEGTPFPLDEAQAENREPGLFIDYAVRNAHTPVALDVLDASGAVLRHWSSADTPEHIDYDHLDIPAHWVSPAPLPSNEPGTHRFVWNFKTQHDVLVPPGTYTVRLSVDGTTYDRHASIARDPRIAASNADLTTQYRLAVAISKSAADVDAARERALALIKRGAFDARTLAKVQALLNPSTRVADPDDSVGKPSPDFSSLRYLRGALGGLSGAVESADAAPTPDMLRAYAHLKAQVITTTTVLATLERTGATH